MSTISVAASRVKAYFLGEREDDVVLNQPGRALARSVLWILGGIACAFYPLGLICGLIANIPAAEYLAGNLAGVLLTGLFSDLILVFVLLVVMVCFPVLRRAKLPRSTSRGHS